MMGRIENKNQDKWISSLRTGKVEIELEDLYNFDGIMNI